jgi:HD-like signal output (HDOD) protein
MQVAEVFDKASGKLPMIPKVVQELVNSFNQTDVVNNAHISQTVGHDQVLTARVLRLANTARFGGSRRVGSLDEALIVLGFDTLRVLVIASGVTGATGSIPDFDLKSFWQSCFEIANTSRVLARLAQQNQQLAYTCGLLARIGELVLHVAIPETTPEIDRAVTAGQSRIAVERALLGVDSAQVGAELAWRWSFPQNMIDAIGQQHPLGSRNDAAPLSTLICLARYLVTEFNQGREESGIMAGIPPETLAQLGLEADKVAEAMPELKEASTTIDNLL